MPGLPVHVVCIPRTAGTGMNLPVDLVALLDDVHRARQGLAQGLVRLGVEQLLLVVQPVLLISRRTFSP